MKLPSAFLLLVSLIGLLLSCSSCSLSGSRQNFGPDGKRKTVVLDIGHYISGNRGTGAASPAMPGGRLEETLFWYTYAGYVRNEIREAGYDCVITNRGHAPTGEPFLSKARQNSVTHLNRPDTHSRRGGITRYPSQYHPECLGAGIISADYAISRKAACVVFLHHDSASSSWRPIYRSTIFHNKNSGKPLGEAIAATLNETVIGSGDKMPNGGRACKPAIRARDGTGGAGWLNTCDKEHIPAAIIEAAQLCTPAHARWLADDKNAIRFARGVGQGIVRYLDSSDSEKR